MSESSGMRPGDVVLMAMWCGGSITISVGVCLWLLTVHANGVHDKAVSLSTFNDYRVTAERILADHRSLGVEVKQFVQSELAGIKADIRDVNADVHRIDRRLNMDRYPDTYDGLNE